MTKKQRRQRQRQYDYSVHEVASAVKIARQHGFLSRNEVVAKLNLFLIFACLATVMGIALGIVIGHYLL